MAMTKQELILDYIEQFRYFGVNAFSYGTNAMAGHSYHFTLILRHRFGPAHCAIMYDEAHNYFATKIEGRIYDICGDITDDACYKWERWNDFQKREPMKAKLVRRDSILLIPDEERSCELCAHCFYDEIMCSFLCDKDNLIVDTYGVCRRED